MHLMAIYGGISGGSQLLAWVPTPVLAAITLSYFGWPLVARVLERWFDDPIMRKHVNEGSVGWQSGRRPPRPDPRKFRM